MNGLAKKEIAKKYGISIMSISDYVSGKSWKHLTDGPSLEELRSAKRKTPAAKINKQIADQIRTRLAAGELGKDLAVEFGVHKATVSDIKCGKVWR